MKKHLAIRSLRDSLTIIVIIMTVSIIVAFSTDDPILLNILTKFQTYSENRPQEKLYVMLDKDVYLAGEDIWFSTFLVNASGHTYSTLSKTIYVELFNTARTLVQRRVVFSPEGRSQGNFQLTNNLAQGTYIVRAYTNYMKNIGDDFFFMKEITIINPESTKTISPVATLPDIQFFPEGGELLSNVENQVAFKAIDQSGRGINISGDIVDETGTLLTSFSTEHNGMGTLRFTPVYGHHYHASLKNIAQSVPLPEPLEKGFMLRVTDFGPDLKITAYSNLKKFSSDPCIVYLIAQSHGVIRYVAKGEILSTALGTKIPKSKLPSGITQITLFDASGSPQCERLFFVNHQDQLRLSLSTDKTSYGKNNPVNFTIEAKTKNGSPAEGDFTVSVVDETRLSGKQYAPTIVNNLLLTSDLHGTVEDPGYYLRDTLSKTKSHVDLLMLTHGWRRFTWKTVLGDSIPPLQYFPEKGIVVSGTLLKSLSKKPSPDSKVKIMTEQQDIFVLKTDATGKFYTDELLIPDSTKLLFQTDNAKGKQTDLQFLLDPFNPPAPLTYSQIVTIPRNFDSLAYNVVSHNNPNLKGEKTTVLKEVEVKATRIDEEKNSNVFKIYGTPDATVKMDNLPSGYTSVLQAIQGRVAGVMVIGNSVSIRGGGPPLFLLNGMQVDIDMINSIPVSSIESIDILKGASATIFGGRGSNGVIAINLKQGMSSYSRPTVGIHNVKYPGYYKAREFYSPDYDVIPVPKDTLDIRNTLYWNPSVKTTNGKATIRFFSSSVQANYKIIVEGISDSGTPGYEAYDLRVN